MSVIEAAAMRCRTMADGSLRIECEVEPRNAQAAFSLFGSPGTPMALAALKTVAQKQEKPKGGELSKWAAMRCQEPLFQEWLKRQFSLSWEHSIGSTPTERAASTIRGVCSIDSRADLDNDQAAAQRFHELIRGPWQKHHLAANA